MAKERHPTVSVRLARGLDLAEAAEVHEAAFATVSHIYRPVGDAARRQAARALEGVRLVATAHGRVAGTVQIAVHAAHVHLVGLAVLPELRGLGVGRALVEDAVARTPSLGRWVVAVDTIEETGNVPFFERLGFHVVRREVADFCASDVATELHHVQLERAVDG